MCKYKEHAGEFTWALARVLSAIHPTVRSWTFRVIAAGKRAFGANILPCLLLSYHFSQPERFIKLLSYINLHPYIYTHKYISTCLNNFLYRSRNSTRDSLPSNEKIYVYISMDMISILIKTKNRLSVSDMPSNGTLQLSSIIFSS